MLLVHAGSSRQCPRFGSISLNIHMIVNVISASGSEEI